MKLKLVVLLFILLTSQAVMAFDADREGFVLSAGAGIAPIAYTEISGLSESRNSGVGYAVSFMTGYGYNENTLFFLMWEGLRANSLSFDDESEKVWQGFTGAGVRFYFGDIGSSFFIESGLGLQFYNSSDTIFYHDSGLGVLIGAGYEISDHLQLQTNLSNGQTKDSFKWQHFQFIVTASYILY